jgi:hypothetical protein
VGSLSKLQIPYSIPASAEYWVARTVLAELVPRERLLTKAKNGVNSREPTAKVIKVAGRDFPPSALNF